MPSLAIRAKNIRALEALVRECGFGWTLPKQSKLRYARVPTGAERLEASLSAGPYPAFCEKTTADWFPAGERD